MASITVRDIDDPLKAELRVRAARHGGGVDLPEIPRGDDRDPPDFSE